MSFDYVIEKQWVTKEGFLASIVFFARDGARRGYISLPEGHKLEGVKWDDPILEDIEVHGGLTFAGYADFYYQQSKNFWTFGFDCVHAWDLPDAEIYPQLFRDRKCPNEIMHYIALPASAEIRTEAYVANELAKLSEQLAKIAEEDRLSLYCPCCGEAKVIKSKEINTAKKINCECGCDLLPVAKWIKTIK